MSKVSYIPKDYNSVTPYLIVKNAAQAIDYYKKVFGATETVRMPGPDGKIGHAELKIGNSHIMLADENPSMGAGHVSAAAIGVVLIVIFVVFAVFAPWIAPQDPAAIDLPGRLTPPNRAHSLGTDELGRDILSRVIYGARISMLVGSCVVVLSLALGLIIGSIAGFYGGAVDRFVNVVVMNAFLSFP